MIRNKKRVCSDHFENWIPKTEDKQWQQATQKGDGPVLCQHYSTLPSFSPFKKSECNSGVTADFTNALFRTPTPFQIPKRHPTQILIPRGHPLPLRRFCFAPQSKATTHFNFRNNEEIKHNVTRQSSVEPLPQELQ